MMNMGVPTTNVTTMIDSSILKECVLCYQATGVEFVFVSMVNVCN